MDPLSGEHGLSHVRLSLVGPQHAVELDLQGPQRKHDLPDFVVDLSLASLLTLHALCLYLCAAAQRPDALGGELG